MKFLSLFALWLAICGRGVAAQKSAQPDFVSPNPAQVLAGLRGFFIKTARPDGSFANGVGPHYRGMSDSVYSDLAAVTYAVTLNWNKPGQIKLWDTATLQLRQTLATSGEVLSVACSPDGRTIAAGCGDGTVRAWAVE